MQVAFDFDDVLPTVLRAHSAANRDDAEEAIQVAVAEALEKGWEMTAPNIVTCARRRLLNAMRRRERSNVSLDAFLEADEDTAPKEIAIEEVDFDSHVELAEIAANPVMRRRMEAVKRGNRPVIHRHWGGWSLELAVEAVRAFVREEGRRPTSKDFLSDPRLPGRSILWDLGHNNTTISELAGTPPPPKMPGPWSREAILAAYRAFYARAGRWPKDRERRRANGFPGLRTTLRVLGTTSIREIGAMAEAMG
jgi:DNA-directed RNA polymerase specialized sigma24 family protein